MNKKLISKCCHYNIVEKWTVGGYFCLNCGEDCEVIEESIPQPIQSPTRKEIDRDCLMAKVYPHHEPIQKEEDKEMEELLNKIDKNDNSWEPNDNTSYNPDTGEEILKDKNPTPSDTFIEEKMKEFDKLAYPIVHSNTFPKKDEEYLNQLKSFLKSSLQQQEQRVREEVEKVKIDKAHTYSSENADEYRAYDKGQEDMLERIKQLLTNK